MLLPLMHALPALISHVPFTKPIATQPVVGPSTRKRTSSSGSVPFTDHKMRKLFAGETQFSKISTGGIGVGNGVGAGDGAGVGDGVGALVAGVGGHSDVLSRHLSTQKPLLAMHVAFELSQLASQH